MNLPLDPGRVVRARVLAAFYDTSRRRRTSGTGPAPSDCDGAGYKLRRSCADHSGLYPCPLCDQAVTARPYRLPRARVVQLDRHPGRPR